jgi:hypothetical protein
MDASCRAAFQTNFAAGVNKNVVVMGFMFREPESGASLAAKTRARLYALCHTINEDGIIDSKEPVPILFCGLKSAAPGSKLVVSNAATALKAFWTKMLPAPDMPQRAVAKLGKRVSTPVTPFADVSAAEAAIAKAKSIKIAYKGKQTRAALSLKKMTSEKAAAAVAVAARVKKAKVTATLKRKRLAADSRNGKRVATAAAAALSKKQTTAAEKLLAQAKCTMAQAELKFQQADGFEGQKRSGETPPRTGILSRGGMSTDQTFSSRGCSATNGGGRLDGNTVGVLGLLGSSGQHRADGVQLSMQHAANGLAGQHRADGVQLSMQHAANGVALSLQVGANQHSADQQRATSLTLSHEKSVTQATRDYHLQTQQLQTTQNNFLASLQMSQQNFQLQLQAQLQQHKVQDAKDSRQAQKLDMEQKQMECEQDQVLANQQAAVVVPDEEGSDVSPF